MGTKRALTAAVSDAISYAQPGTMLDAFAGMCAVGEAVGASRQVWNNDIQIFASEVAKGLFVSRSTPLSPLTYGDIHFDRFQKQMAALSRSFAKSLAVEQSLLEANSFPIFLRRFRCLGQVIANDSKACRLRSPHLFSCTYAGTYFGVRQAIEADAIIASLITPDTSKTSRHTEVVRWGKIALGRALLKVANSPGHFAQYLKPKHTNYRRHLALRRRSLWAEWLTSIDTLSPVGTAEWRAKNRVFNEDSLTLIPRLAREGSEISVIYADPPYTDDQYSRFYHILETLCLYDYPRVTGAGLYRPNRFRTPFSLKSEAPEALGELIASAARTGADLILSYPENGLAVKAGANVKGLLKKHFRRVEVSRSVTHNHSTFGASKGAAQSEATELIYLARSA
jgi:adenine-specific DNA-methyltransferase